MVTYDGLWLGGFAFVYATSEEEALSLVEADSRTVNFSTEKRGPMATKISPQKDGPVIFNDNGDY